MMMRKAILSISLLILCALPATAQTFNPFASEETVQHLAHTGPNFRIRRGGGSVTVNADGSITVAPLAGTSVTSTGTSLGPNGTAALPAFSFTSDPDTGIYRQGANQIGFSTLGTLRVSISNGGLNLFSGNALILNGGTSGSISLIPPATVTSYVLTWPSAVSRGGLISDSGGVLSFVAFYNTGTPAIAGNGTLNTNSQNSAGKVTSTATGASTVVLTFSTQFTNAPACMVTNETTANPVRPVSTVGTLTINATVVTSDVLSYICLGY